MRERGGAWCSFDSGHLTKYKFLDLRAGCLFESRHLFEWPNIRYFYEGWRLKMFKVWDS